MFARVDGNEVNLHISSEPFSSLPFILFFTKLLKGLQNFAIQSQTSSRFRLIVWKEMNDFEKVSLYMPNTCFYYRIFKFGVGIFSLSIHLPIFSNNSFELRYSEKRLTHQVCCNLLTDFKSFSLFNICLRYFFYVNIFSNSMSEFEDRKIFIVHGWFLSIVFSWKKCRPSFYCRAQLIYA